jgi:O-antigen ligase
VTSLSRPSPELRVAWARRRVDVPMALLVAAVVLLAAAIGGLSALNGKYAIVVACGLVFGALVFVDLLIGFAAIVMLGYLDMLSQLGGVSLSKLAGLLLVVAWLAVASTGDRRARNLFAERPGLTYLLLAFLGWNAISLAWADSPSTGMSSVMRYTLNAVLVPIAYTAVRDRRDIVRVLVAIVFGATLAALSAIANPTSADSAAFGRATGTIGDPNELAAALVVGLAIAGAFAVNRHIGSLWRALSGFTVLLCFTGILLSLSRGGLIGVGGMVVAAVLAAGRWRARVLAVGLSVALAGVAYFAFFASLPAKERVTNVGGGGTGRLDLWTVGGRMVSAHPLTGVGTGNFPVASVHYLLKPGAIQRGDLILSTPKVAHNTYLNMVAEIGLVGGVLFVAILLISIGSMCLAVRELRRDGDERLEILMRGLVVAMGGYLTTLMFISENYSKLMWFLLALGPVLLAVVRESRTEPQAGTLRASTRRATARSPGVSSRSANSAAT